MAAPVQLAVDSPVAEHAQVPTCQRLLHADAAGRHAAQQAWVMLSCTCLRHPERQVLHPTNTRATQALHALTLCPAALCWRAGPPPALLPPPWLPGRPPGRPGRACVWVASNTHASRASVGRVCERIVRRVAAATAPAQALTAAAAGSCPSWPAGPRPRRSHTPWRPQITAADLRAVCSCVWLEGCVCCRRTMLNCEKFSVCGHKR